MPEVRVARADLVSHEWQGADSAFSDLLSEGASPASAGGGGSSAGGGCNRARVGAAAPKQCVVCTW
jgi:hypothetical protein